MREDGVEVGSELVIPGALGEELENKWCYIEKLREWETWEANRDSRPDLVKYSDVEVLSRALSLPYGWEAHTMIDTSYPLQDRVRHMLASLAYLEWRKHSVSAIYSYMDTMVEALYKRAGNIILPFLRNIYLKDDNGFNASIFTQIDWEALLKLLPSSDKCTTNLAKFVLGQNEEPCMDYGIMLTSNDIPHLHMMIAESSLITLYTNILHSMPEDISPISLGMAPICVISPIPLGFRMHYGLDALSGEKYITLSHLVGWINSFIIVRYASKSKNGNLRDTITILSTNVGIVQKLYKTIGLYAMRRILISLRGYDKAVNDPKWSCGLDIGKVSAADAYRAEMFANELEKSLEQHKGEDEGVKKLALGY
jgi:hypothetical protein